jgi:ubiquinone/menaquinone biosynthesis C-methylase UbiE
MRSLLPVALYLRVIRWAFHHFYREFAWTYDAVAWVVSGGLWQSWARASLPFLRGRVLEIGFGPGHLQRSLAAQAGPAACGIDASAQMVRMASRRLARAGLPQRLARATAQRLPFAPASFDTVLATFPAEYIVDPQTHAEIARVLAPAGRIVVLPLAQLDDAPLARLIDLAYRLTLQAPARRSPPADSAPLGWSIADVALAPHWVRVGPSRALLLVGDRAGA